jgi:flagellar hook assembly protein FlgD
MTLLRAVLVALVLALAAPAAVLGSDRFSARDEPVSATGATSPLAAPRAFDLVGLHWKGTGTVRFRTLSSGGGWSGWRAAAVETEDAPDSGSPERARRSGWHLGSPYWTGASTSIQYRFEGGVSQLRAYFIWSDPHAHTALLSRQADARVKQPAVIRRAQWGADESIVRAKPSYAPRVQFAVVHHTAGTNSYSAAESAAIVRGIERYHVLANGWNDIGYNFLVDKYGQVFEGRGGGITRNVVGAHAEGFNTGSTGVAVLGNYESHKVSPAAKAALVRLLAWRLDVAHVDPLGRLTWISGGNPKYPAGARVNLRVIAGHRDTGPTSCPGAALYAQLPGVARAVARRGLPKLYSPAVTGSLGGPVRFTGSLTAALDWTVTVRDATGAIVATGAGTGKSVDWTWDASAIPFGNYRYSIGAGHRLLPAQGRIPGPPPLEVTSLELRAKVLTPNGDGVKDSATASYALSRSATVRVDVIDSSSRIVRSPAIGQAYRGGLQSVTWNGRNSAGKPVRDGVYRLRLSATSPGQEAVKRRRLVVDRTLGHLTVGPTPFSPTGDGRLDTTTARFLLSRQADVRVRIMEGHRTVAKLHRRGPLAPGRAEFAWDGLGKAGAAAADGTYRVLVEATTALGTRMLSSPVTVDTRAPVVRVVSDRVKNRRTRVRLWLSEAATVRVRYASPDWQSGGFRTVHRSAGYSRLSLPRATKVRLQAADSAANVGTLVTVRTSG